MAWTVSIPKLRKSSSGWPVFRRESGPDIHEPEPVHDKAAIGEETAGPLWLGTDFHPDLAISLGSSTIAVLGKKSVDISGYVATEVNTGKVLTLGEPAHNLEGRAPADVRVTRPVRNGAVVDFELTQKLFEAAFKKARSLGMRGPRVLLAVSSDLSPMERQAAVQAARQAGARQVQLVEQPLVAALGGGSNILRPQASMVIDVGAGNLQVGVISMGNLLSSRVLRMAGDRMDEEIRTYIRRTRHVLIAERTAETLKNELGHALKPENNHELGVAGCDLESGMPVRFTVTADEVYEAIRPTLESMAEHLKQTLSALPTRLLGDVMKEGALLTGGVARLPDLAFYLERETNLPMRVAEHPEKAAAAGLDVLLHNRTLRRAVLIQEPPALPKGGRRKSSGRTLALCLLLASLALTLAYSVQIRKEEPTPLDSAISRGLAPLWSIPAHQQNSLSSDLIRAQLAERDGRLAALTRENRVLRKLGKMPLKDTPTIVARVVSHDPRGWLSYLVLDRGLKDGIHSGMPVVSGDGVVGQIAYSDENSSRVRLLTDPRSVISGAVHGRRSAGVTYGQGSHVLQMRYLDPDAKIRVGDRVVTGAQSTGFPPGLAIGRVTAVVPASHEISASATVAPAVKNDELTDVLVLQGDER